jgi:coatomer subunit beta
MFASMWSDGDAVPAERTSADEESRKFLQRLNRVTQLSGFSDPIYAEATVTIHPFDVVLDIYLVNQSEETLNNVTVELAATGDLKLCERPQTFLMPPGSAVTTRASLKVSSTETGVIYGTIVFDSSKQDQQYIVLNEMRVDMMEYVKPMTCSHNDFRAMWAEFDWENKVNVASAALGTDLSKFAEQIAELCNMQELACGGGASAEQIQQSGFLSTSLYARSTFGEHVLANFSVELVSNDEAAPGASAAVAGAAVGARVEGVIRIRSKYHAIALALGNKIKARCNQ